MAQIVSRPLFQGILSPLTVPDYRRLEAGNALWWLVIWMEQVVTGWLVLEMTNSAWHVALVGFCRSIPFLLVGLFSGLLTSRFRRRTIILGGQSIYILVFSLFAILLWRGHLTFWQVALGELIVGIAWTPDWAVRRALLPELLGKSRTVEGMVVENLAVNLSMVVGPFAGGLLIRSYGVLGGYLAIVAFLVLGLLSLSRLSGGSLPPRSRTIAPLKNAMDGLRYVRGSPPILGVLLVTVLMNVFLFPYMTLMPLFARDVLGQGPVGLGLLGAAGGAGAFFGALLINWLKRFGRNGWVFAGGSLLQTTAMVAFSASRTYPLSAGLMVLSGMGQAGFVVLQSGIILVASQDDMRDRAMGALSVAIGTGPIGQLLIGQMASRLGAPLAVGLTCATAAVGIAAVTAALPGLRGPDEART